MRRRDILRLLDKAQGILGGNQRSFAEAVGVRQPSIFHAKKAGHVSAELARDIHLATDGAVPCWELRPDLWRPGSRIPDGE
jgi:DNA-binding transcriptional regulator YdaS (Cro superfamily)